MKRSGCLPVLAMIVLLALGGVGPAGAGEPLVIAASPSLKRPLESVARAFEAMHPEVKIQLHLDKGLELRQTIAAIENGSVGQYFLGGSPIHLIAPGGDELIIRLEQKYYVVPGSARTYARERLVLVVPEQLVEAPTSFEEIHKSVTRLAVADPDRSVLGRQTRDVLRSLKFQGRLDVATDTRGVLDHILSGEADAGIIFGHDAAKEGERVRVVAVAEAGYVPIAHSIAMQRSCPNKQLCGEFLAFTQSAEARRILIGLGYAVPGGR